MFDTMFEDYIKLYKNINKSEWIVIFDENEEKNYENDIFTFCAMIDKEKVYENKYMEKFNWEFSTESFGRAGFGIQGWGDNEEVYFYDGITSGEFEYLVALRHFKKYENSVEINPKLLWYGNLALNKDGYVNPITDELIIKVNKHHIEVRKEYLKDFLCSYGKACVIVFDHRRYFNSDEEISEVYENYADKNYFINLSVGNAIGYNSNYNSCSCLIGKAIISPYKKPHHRDYRRYTNTPEYEKFIIDYDEDNDENIEYTCDENLLANYFGANPNAPHFLTPTFFDIKVLDKYKNDPRNYIVGDSTITFLHEWSIPFNINKENKVSVWLGDLGRIPFEEQKYWKSFNIIPCGEMEKKFVDRQVRGIWTDASRIESKLVPTINRLNSIISEKYDGVIFNILSEADKEIYNTFMIPTNYSLPEYQSFLLKLSKLVAESINVKLIKSVMGDSYDKEIKGSISQLEVFLKYIKLDENGKISSAIKKAYNCRNKLAGHSASFGEYNKVWGRDKDYKFNSIEDARKLVKDIIESIEYVIANYEVRYNED